MKRSSAFTRTTGSLVPPQFLPGPFAIDDLAAKIREVLEGTGQPGASSVDQAIRHFHGHFTEETVIPLLAARFLGGRPLPGPGRIYGAAVHVYEW